MILRYLRVVSTALLTFGTFLLTFFAMRGRSKAKEAKVEKARREHAERVMQEDEEIQREYDKRTEDLAREVEEKGTSTELSNPNNW